MFKGFGAFIARGNVIDLAVGVVIGAAFTSIVNSLVNDIISPIIGLLLGGVDFSNVFIDLSGEGYETLAAAQEAGAATVNIGLFINAIITFLITALAVFYLVKAVNRFMIEWEKRKKAEEEAIAEESPIIPTTDEKILETLQKLNSNIEKLSAK